MEILVKMASGKLAEQKKVRRERNSKKQSITQ